MIMKQAVSMAAERLEEAGFHELDLADLGWHTPTAFDNKSDIRTAVFYDLVSSDRPAAAPEVVIEALPWSTTLDDASIQVRLAAHQMALGDDYALVGLELYNPFHKRLTGTERREIATGDFEVFATRTLRVLEALAKTGQKVNLYGFSFGADTHIETAHENYYNPNRGVCDIARVGAWEAVRSTAHGNLGVVRAWKVAQNFNRSGKQLWENVAASDSPALLEARGVSAINEKERRHHDRQVGKDVVRAWLADPLGQTALGAGFGTDLTIQQLIRLSNGFGDTIPKVKYGTTTESLVSPADFERTLHNRLVLPLNPRIEIVEVPGDHSIGDNLIWSSGAVLHSVEAGV